MAHLNGVLRREPSASPQDRAHGHRHSQQQTGWEGRQEGVVTQTGFPLIAKEKQMYI